jgi:hypothetical protein
MVDIKNIKIPLKIGEFILENSLFKVSKLLLHINKSKSFSNDDIKRSEDIDSGVCGIILFLIELNKIRPEPKFQKAILDAGADLINHCRTTSRLHYGFLKGRAGVCYTLIRLSEATGEEKFLKYALELIKNESDNFIKSEFTTNRLYDGLSGLLLVLLCLYNIEQDYWIIERVNLCLDRIVSDFIITEQGIIWNKRDRNIKPLNSFLFGSSGVAFTLIQVAEFFKDDQLLSMAKSIFAYEDVHWNDGLSHWPDFRKEIITGSDYLLHKSRYLSKDFDFFKIPLNTYDFAYGTAGLCLARLPLLNGKDKDKDHFSRLIVNGLSKIQDFKTENLSFVNGISGFGSLYLEASKYLSIKPYNKKILEIADILINKEVSFQDISLFYGVTGIGYFLLQLSQPEDFASVLFPIIDRKKTHKESGMIRIRGPEYLAESLQVTFPQTFIILQIMHPEHYSEIVKQDHSLICNETSNFITGFISTLKRTMPRKHNQLIWDIFDLESAKLRMFSETKSLSLNHIRGIIKFEEKVRLLNMEEQELMFQSLVFDADSQIIKCKWNWARLSQEGANIPKIISELLSTEPKEVILVLTMNGNNEIIEEKLDTLGQLTRKIFRKPQQVRKAIKKYLEAFEIENDTDRDEILSYIKQDINFYIKKSLLHSAS